MDFQVIMAGGELWVGVGSGCGGVGETGELSDDSEDDLALMVSDFWENGSEGGDSWCSNESEIDVSDLSRLAEKIPYCKHSLAEYESDLLSLVHSLLQSIDEMDLQFVKSGPCNASCIRFSLVNLLRLSGHDAAVCSSKWQGAGKVPGGDHEYIDVVNYDGSGISERLLIDVDFQSHFEIARAVESYDRILKSLPVVYVGSFTRLKQFIHVMVEAARSSLNQNSMPLPPWRSVAYLHAKWQSPYKRMFNPDDKIIGKENSFNDNKQCSGHLKRVQSLLQTEMESERLSKTIKSDENWRIKPERLRHHLFSIH